MFIATFSADQRRFATSKEARHYGDRCLDAALGGQALRLFGDAPPPPLLQPPGNAVGDEKRHK